MICEKKTDVVWCFIWRQGKMRHFGVPLFFAPGCLVALNGGPLPLSPHHTCLYPKLYSYRPLVYPTITDHWLPAAALRTIVHVANIVDPNPNQLCRRPEHSCYSPPSSCILLTVWPVKNPVALLVTSSLVYFIFTAIPQDDTQQWLAIPHGPSIHLKLRQEERTQ